MLNNNIYCSTLYFKVLYTFLTENVTFDGKRLSIIHEKKMTCTEKDSFLSPHQALNLYYLFLYQLF